MSGNNDRNNPKNPESELYKKLTKIFSGPIVNQRSQNTRKYRRDKLDKFAKVFKDTQGRKFQRAQNDRIFRDHSAQYLSTFERAQRYADFELMEFDPILASVLDIYADEMTSHNQYQKILHVKSEKNEIRDILSSFFYNVLNVEYNLYSWARQLCKKGDFFLYLDVDERLGIKRVIVLPPDEIERVEGLDKDNPDYVQYKWSTGNVVFENFQVAHFKIDGNDKYAPLGTSVLESARRIFRQLTLMEDAMMAYRVVRATERKVYYIDIGGIPPEDIEQHMLGIMQSTKKNQVVDPQSGRVDLRYNALSLEDDIYIPVRGTEQGTRIESLPGGDMVGAIDDIKYMKDKLFAAVKIPQSYLIRGEGGEEEKGTLAQKDIRFARTIQRLQRSLVAELDKIAKIHLYTLGYRNADLISFEIILNNPSKLAEQQELEHWKTKFDVASSAIEACVSERWIAKNLLNLSDEEFLRNRQEILHDVAFAQLKALAEKGGIDGAASTGGGGSALSDFGPGPEEGGEEMPTGADGNEGGGFDLPFSPGDTAAGSIPGEGAEESDSMLLATPGNDSQLKEQGHLTPGSKGHVYHPVKDDQRDDGAKTRSFRQAASSRQARMTKGQVNIRLHEIMNKVKSKAIYEEDSFVSGLNEETKAILENLKKTGVNKK